MKTSYDNPVVRGNAPDPSIVRVGNDYYLATSTMEFLPGIVIRHSINLVDWRIIGAAATRPFHYRRDGQPGEINLCAPTLRFHDGMFYLVSTNVAAGQGNFIVRATDPAGEWSDALWLDSEAFDPSLLFDDGAYYYTRRTLSPLSDGRLGPIVQTELDIATGRLSPLRELTPDYSGFCSNDIEGPLPSGPARQELSRSVWTDGWATLGAPAPRIRFADNQESLVLAFGNRLAVYTDPRHHFSALASRRADDVIEVSFRRRIDDLETTTLELKSSGAMEFTITASAGCIYLHPEDTRGRTPARVRFSPIAVGRDCRGVCRSSIRAHCGRRAGRRGRDGLRYGELQG